METIIGLIGQYPQEFVGLIFFIMIGVFSVFFRRLPNADVVAKMLGVSTQVKDILLYIFKYTELDHNKLNEDKQILNKPVYIPENVTTGEAKMMVAIEAMKAHKDTKKLALKLEKAGKLAMFMSYAYRILKPYFKSKK